MQASEVERLSPDGGYTTETVLIDVSDAQQARVRQNVPVGFTVKCEKGYARVSDDQQDLALQIEALKKAGCTVIYKEKISGKTRHRPMLIRMMSELEPGDRVNVWKTDRLGRSALDSMMLLAEMNEKQAAFRSLTEPVDTATPMGMAFMQMLMVFAELERNNIVQRVKAGLAVSQANGIVGGTRRALDGDQVAKAREAYANRPTSPVTGKPMTTTELAALFGVHRATFLRWAQPDYFTRPNKDAARFRTRHPDLDAWIERSNDPHFADSPRRRHART